jgi:hypothetical protein
MSINSRLGKIERCLSYRELALLWLKSSQAKGGYSEYWKFSEFQPWAAENEEAGLLYHLATTVNGTVLLAAQQWRVLASWASLLSISMLDVKPQLRPFEPHTVGGFFERWRNALCRLFAEVVAVQQAVDLISEEYVDGHEVLFADAKAELSSSFENAKLLVLGYNCFAAENGKELIDIETVANQVGRRVAQRRNEWVMLSRSEVLAASGQLFEARDEVLAFIATEDAAENDPAK